MTQGVGMKSQRTEALELRRKMDWSPERIAEALGADVVQVREWLFGKPRQAMKSGGAISPASPAQREKVKGRACIRCRIAGGCHPAHLIDKSLASDDDGDARAVVPLCPSDHREYDEGRLSLLEFLEPHYREELAYAVERVGLISALERIDNQRWWPEGKAA
jgi:hypothetical protein